MNTQEITTATIGALKQGRLNRTLALMRRHNVEVLLVASSDSIRQKGRARHLTNYSTDFGICLALLTQDKELVLFVPDGSFQFDWAGQSAWATEIVAANDLAAAVIDWLRSGSGSQSSIGVAGLEEIPGCIAVRLQEALPDSTFIDLSQPFDLLMAVKLEEEIRMARRSVELADKAFQAIKQHVRTGNRINRAFATAEYELTVRGAEQVFLLAGSGQMTVMPRPTGNRLEKFDVLRFSIEVASPGGFWTQTIRSYSLGGPSNEAQANFELCSEALERAVERLRPGRTGGQIARAMIDVLGRANGGRIGPLGHGMGLDLTEPPYLLASDETVIEPGMVVTIHPHLTWDNAKIWIGDTYLVTPGEPEKLSTIPNELLVI